MEVSAIHSIVTSEETLIFELLTYLTGNYPFRLGKGTVTCCAGCFIEFLIIVGFTITQENSTFFYFIKHLPLKVIAPISHQNAL